MHRHLSTLPLRVAVTSSKWGGVTIGCPWPARGISGTAVLEAGKRRRKIREEEMNMPSFSRTTKVHELNRRLAEYERSQSENGEGTVEKDRWSVESEATERMMRANRDRYASVFARREADEKATMELMKKEEEKLEKQEESFPFRTEPIHPDKMTSSDSTFPDTPPSESSSLTSSVPLTDQGFFISGNLYMDEYRAATINDLPEDEMTVSSREVYGVDDAVETIDFQLPGQALHNSAATMDMDEMDDEDVEDMQSERKCGGCGANFHCMDDSLPGYLPPILFAKEERKAERRSGGEAALCKRCHLVKNHHFLPNVNVCPVDYATMLSKLRGRQEVLIVLVVDILDLPGSIHRALPDIIGRGKPMIVVANKVDLLPPDARCGYLKRFKQTVERALADAGFADAFNILHTALVSAKTGYGIEDLITEIHVKWTNVRSAMRDDIYLVGCTNAGKSTLFNTLLQSDLCKVRAVDLVERATTSVWPGTTLSLLKFPMMRPSAYKLELRRRRLVSHRAWIQKEAYARKRSLQRTGDSDMAVLVEPVMNTYKDREEELQPRAVASLLDATGDVDDNDGMGKKKRGRSWSLDDEVFTKGAWCYDTPGTVNHEQLLDVFSLRELVNIMPSRLLRPRTVIMHPGRSLLIGGALARMDLLHTEKPRPVWVTVFANDALPLNVMDIPAVDDFIKKNRGRSALGAPIGDESRLAALPPLESRILEVVANEEDKKPWMKEKEDTLIGSADVVFSSIGWAMVSTHAGKVTVSASIIGGRGLVARSPPILPYAAQLRGARIPATDFYKVNPPSFPVNLLRMRADKNRRRFKGGRRNNRNDDEEEDE